MPDHIALLKQSAKNASKNSYCKYSKFAVGSAILANNNRIFQGCNIENASYGLTVCAERSTIFTAIGYGAHSFTDLAIYVAGPEIYYSCGACRQVIAEFCSNIQIHFICDDDSKSKTVSIQDLFPLPFRLS